MHWFSLDNEYNRQNLMAFYVLNMQGIYANVKPVSVYTGGV